MRKTINSWGNTSKKIITEKNTLENGEVYLTVGNQNSYGDASVPLNNYTYKNISKITNPKHFDTSKTLEDYMLQANTLLLGLPGKSNVTIGGAIASDVHGKDGLWGGSFINNIKEMNIILSNNQKVTCSRTKNSELFYTTAGGFGLTGSIISVELFKTIPQLPSTFTSKIIKGKSISNLLKNFTNNENEYSVAWIDLLSKSKKWVLDISKPLKNKSKKEENLIEEYSDLNFSFGFIGNNKLNLMKAINAIYFISKNQNKDIINSRKKVFYPLNFVTNTKNISSKREIVQVQFSIPIKNEFYLNEILELLIFNQTPLLCSLKRMGANETDLNLSFIQNGWVVAVDFPSRNFDNLAIRKFYKRLIELEGRIYLAKDSTLDENEFKSMYPEFHKWQKIVKKLDPNKIFQSELSDRLGLKNW